MATIAKWNSSPLARTTKATLAFLLLPGTVGKGWSKYKNYNDDDDDKHNLMISTRSHER